MVGEAFLLTLAQLGVGVAGFSGLIVSLPRPTAPDSASWTTREASGVKLILEYSFALVFLSLLPLTVAYLLGSEERAWEVAAWFARVVIVLETIVQISRLVGAKGDKASPRSPKLLASILTSGLLMVALSFLITIPVSGWYAATMVWLLCAIGAQFWFFIKAHLGV